MNEEMKKRYQQLKEKNSKRIKEMNWKNNALFTECINMLHDCCVITLDETDKLFNEMQMNFPITSYGYIDWNKIKNFLILNDISDIFNICNINDEYYILWEQKDLPCVNCKLSTVLENINDVLAVSFDTWLLSNDKSEVIEFYHEGMITYGKII